MAVRITPMRKALRRAAFVALRRFAILAPGQRISDRGSQISHLQIGEVDEPKGVGLTIDIPGDREIAATAVDFDRRRMVAALSVLERAAVLAAEERFDGRQISAAKVKSSFTPVPAGRRFSVGARSGR